MNWGALILLALACFHPAVAGADEPTPEPTPEQADPPPASDTPPSTPSPEGSLDLEPPKVLHLPDIVVEESAEAPSVIRVTVLIREDGSAEVQDCVLEESLCALASAAVASAVFRPAMRDGVAVPSRVNVAIRIRALKPAVPDGQTGDSEEPVADSGLTFSAFAEVESRAHTPIELDIEGLRNVPGALGEPLRALEILPGVTPLTNGQPYVYVRGAPPSGTVYFYDGIPMPMLFHAIVGPTVLQSRFIGDVKAYQGVAPARYGRLTGAVNVAEGPRDLPLDRVHGSIQLRAIDASALVTVPIAEDGSLMFAGQVGYPNWLFKVAQADARSQYWNYQHRSDIAVGKRGRFQLVAFGAKDGSAVDANSTTASAFFLNVQFHRVEARGIARSGRWKLGAALQYGYDATRLLDESGSIPEIEGTLNRVAPRLWASYRHKKVGLRFGADYTRLFGKPTCAETNALNTFAIPCDRAFSNIDRRTVAGVFAEADIDPTHWLSLALGIRSDTWVTGDNRDVGVDPRLRLTFHATDDIDIFAAYGLTHQAAVFSVPLPGYSDVAIEPGLQKTHQMESGLRFQLPHGILIETRAYLNVFRDIRFLDLFTETSLCDPSVTNCSSLNTSADGKSFGAEFMARREFGFGFSGLLSYTLGFTELQTSAQFNAGLPDSRGPDTRFFPLTPTYDVRHVLNAVVSWKSDFGLIIGLRLHARSGRAEGWAYFDGIDVQQYVQRLPVFYRLDASIAYERVNRWGKIRVGLDWYNITLRREPEDIFQDPNRAGTGNPCDDRVGVPAAPCPLTFTGLISIPNLSLAVDF